MRMRMSVGSHCSAGIGLVIVVFAADLEPVTAVAVWKGHDPGLEVGLANGRRPVENRSHPKYSSAK